MTTKTLGVLTLVTWAAALVVSACQREAMPARGDIPAVSAPPAASTPVGPVPGPDKTVARADNPYATIPSEIAEGRIEFNRFNCAGCHGDHAGGGMGPSLRDVDWLYGNADAQVFSSIAEGRAHGMPAWGARLNTDQIWKLVAYIKTLRTSMEAEPPQ